MRLPRRWWWAVLALSLAMLACDVTIDAGTPSSGSGSDTGSGSGVTTAPGALPDMPTKPKPKQTTFNDCPPVGDGGDPAMNRLKNRSDAGDYVPVAFKSIMDLTWPKATERHNRDKWSDADMAEISRYEGIPVMVEGYLYGGKESGPESANCHATDNPNVDWHIWMTAAAGEDRTQSIVIEPTPRSRDKHTWKLKQITAIAKNQLPVRISGWLFYDPEHPDQIGQTRGTIWEIHPVMQIEVQESGQWVALDDWQAP